MRVQVENSRGQWSIEVLDDTTRVHSQGIPAVIGLALSRLDAFKRTDGSTSQFNRWSAGYDATKGDADG